MDILSHKLCGRRLVLLVYYLCFALQPDELLSFVVDLRICPRVVVGSEGSDLLEVLLLVLFREYFLVRRGHSEVLSERNGRRLEISYEVVLVNYIATQASPTPETIQLGPEFAHFLAALQTFPIYYLFMLARRGRGLPLVLSVVLLVENLSAFYSKE